MPKVTEDSATKRKPRAKPGPLAKKPGPAKGTHTNKADAPKSSAQPVVTKSRVHLTLHDWMSVFAYMDKHPKMTQTAVVQHFATLSSDRLKFDQATLSRKLRERPVLEQRALETPNALSSKRARVVTQPRVDRALFLWQKSMESKRETTTGPMLMEKRRRFEIEFNVPEAERLAGPGWIASWKNAYKVKEIRRHGEAASVDLAAVERERVRMRERLARYAPKDRINGDETGLFGYAPPDRGLATQQMSGKKQNKWRITILFTCNADGSEKFPPFFIGKWKQPRCFGKKPVESYGFRYRNNKRAWMTSELFEEYIKFLDLHFRRLNRYVGYTLDNFTGHYIRYEPTHIELIYFDPNLTPFVQPLDAGIIRCFKAHYRRAFCVRAIDLDEAGEADIFAANQLEVMKMAREAWDAVSADTIRNCWAHTGIQRERLPMVKLTIPKSTERRAAPPKSRPELAKDLLRAWISDAHMGLPAVKDQLRELLGEEFIEEKWDGVFDAILGAEDNTEAALTALDRQTLPTFSTMTSDVVAELPDTEDDVQVVDGPSTPAAVAVPALDTAALSPGRHISTEGLELEADLMEKVAELRRRNRIHGPPLTIDELVAPVAEDEVGEHEFIFENGDADIVKRVLHDEAVQRGDIVEVESEDEEDGAQGPQTVPVSNRQMQDMCRMLEAASLQSQLSMGTELPRLLRRFRGELVQAEQRSAKQTTLDAFVAPRAV